jgi:hypothetical protein
MHQVLLWLPPDWIHVDPSLSASPLATCPCLLERQAHGLYFARLRIAAILTHLMPVDCHPLPPHLDSNLFAGGDLASHVAKRQLELLVRALALDYGRHDRLIAVLSR